MATVLRSARDRASIGCCSMPSIRPTPSRRCSPRHRRSRRFEVEPITRVPFGEPVVIKQYLDMGLHSLLVPMVNTAEQAEALVRACRYPPHGIRGVSSATSRGADFGNKASYLHEANDLITLIVQIETVTGLENVEAIAAVEGVDALFIGPSDLAASMGHLGDPMHAEVVEAISRAKAGMDRAGKPAGIFALSPDPRPRLHRRRLPLPLGRHRYRPAYLRRAQRPRSGARLNLRSRTAGIQQGARCAASASSARKRPQSKIGCRDPLYPCADSYSSAHYSDKLTLVANRALWLSRAGKTRREARITAERRELGERQCRSMSSSLAAGVP